MCKEHSNEQTHNHQNHNHNHHTHTHTHIHTRTHTQNKTEEKGRFEHTKEEKISQNGENVLNDQKCGTSDADTHIYHTHIHTHTQSHTQ